MNDPELFELAERVLALLRKNGLTLASAESCTGGWIARELTAVPGSSDVFLGGAVTYANSLKVRFLGVKEETLETAGAVSRECCTQMVQGILKNTGSSCGIAVTGIAGPGGGSPEKPVGLVWIGTAVPGETRVRENHFPGTREEVRRAVVRTALAGLAEQLKAMECRRS